VVRRIVGELARRHTEQGDFLLMAWAHLGLDSLDVLELAVRCEEELGVAIPDRALARCHTAGEVLALLSAGPEGGDRVDHGVIGVGAG
jgi:acyl carrier protein